MYVRIHKHKVRTAFSCDHFGRNPRIPWSQPFPPWALTVRSDGHFSTCLKISTSVAEVRVTWGPGRASRGITQGMVQGVTSCQQGITKRRGPHYHTDLRHSRGVVAQTLQRTCGKSKTDHEQRKPDRSFRQKPDSERRSIGNECICIACPRDNTQAQAVLQVSTPQSKDFAIEKTARKHQALSSRETMGSSVRQFRASAQTTSSNKRKSSVRSRHSDQDKSSWQYAQHESRPKRCRAPTTRTITRPGPMPAAAAAAAERQAAPSQGVPRRAAVEHPPAAEPQAAPSQGAHRPVAVAPLRPAAAAVRAVLGKRQADHLMGCACAFREHSCVCPLTGRPVHARHGCTQAPRQRAHALSLPPCTLKQHRI